MLMQWLKVVLLEKLEGALWNVECPAEGFKGQRVLLKHSHETPKGY